MSLEHAILGFLNYGPSTGYDLKKLFDGSVRHFWPADQSQIYRTLSRLANRGLISARQVIQEDRPNQKVYSLTDKGRDLLMDWLRTVHPHEDKRYSFLIQVFFGGQMEDHDILPVLEKRADELRRRLQGFKELEADSQEKINMYPERDRFFWMLTLEHGIWVEQSILTWLESVIERLKRRDYGTLIQTLFKDKRREQT